MLRLQKHHRKKNLKMYKRKQEERNKNQKEKERNDQIRQLLCNGI